MFENLDRIKKKTGKEVLKEPPKVSVIIPAYNSSAFIAETLDSVFSQNFKDFEVLIVNDGSEDTERLERVLNPYIDKVIYFSQENKGISRARNVAIENARGKYLAFLDSDDLWFPNYLEKQTSEIEKRSCDMIYTDAFLFGDGIKKGTRYTDSAPSRGEFTSESFIKAECQPILSGTVVLRAKVIEQGMFDEDVPWMGMEDFDLWFKLIKNGAKIEYQSEPLIKYRVRPESISGTSLAVLQRDFVCMEHVEKKFNLSNLEKKAVSKRKIKVKAHINLERAKHELAEQNFPLAIKYFKRANEYIRKPKIRIAIFLLNIMPKILFRALSLWQPQEYKTSGKNRR